MVCLDLNTLDFVTAELSFTLLDSITDKDPMVQEQICSALCSLGEAQPDETLRACEEYLRQHDKVPLPLAMVRSSRNILIRRLGGEPDCRQKVPCRFSLRQRLRMMPAGSPPCGEWLCL